MEWENLSAEFPKEAVHWRVQGTPYERNGKFSAMALAYIDARDVMDRLDDVCGPDGWQDSYVETPSGRVICTLSIWSGTEWVSKSDGAGGTQVESEKGGISDALKRAAVKWGIGRYLYRVETPWVGCEVNQRSGKTYWKKWTEDPWSKVKTTQVSPRDTRDRLKKAVEGQQSLEMLNKLWAQASFSNELAALPEPMVNEIKRIRELRIGYLSQAPEKEHA